MAWGSQAAERRYFRCTRFPQFKVLNLHSFGGHDNTLLFFVPPPYSWQIEAKTDVQVLDEVRDCVRTMFGAVGTPHAVIAVSCWGTDEFSRGSYSYIPHVTEARCRWRGCDATATPTDTG